MTEFGSSIDLWLIAEHLERDGYIVLRAPLLKELAAKLLLRCQDDDHGRFHAAQIGRGAAKKRIGTIRGDVIQQGSGGTTHLVGSIATTASTKPFWRGWKNCASG